MSALRNIETDYNEGAEQRLVLYGIEWAEKAREYARELRPAPRRI